jgi:hypothetical protein
MQTTVSLISTMHANDTSSTTLIPLPLTQLCCWVGNQLFWSGWAILATYPDLTLPAGRARLSYPCQEPLAWWLPPSSLPFPLT